MISLITVGPGFHGTVLDHLFPCSCSGSFGSGVGAGRLPVPWRATSLNNRRARAFCACSNCGRGLFGYLFPSPVIYFLSLSLFLWATARYRPKYCFEER